MVLGNQRLSRQEREAAAQRAQEQARDRMRKLIVALLAGRLILTAWRNQMREEITRLHFAIALIAGGDLDNDPQLRARILLEVSQQMRYLERWVVQLNAQVLDPDQRDTMVYRAGLYATATQQTFFLGFTRSLGLPFMPFYPKERTACKVGCKCGWRIVQLKGRGNFNCFWQLGLAEHCATCLARERACSPLKVRGGVIVDPQRYQAIELYA